MPIDHNGRLRIATANSIYHFGPAGQSGSRTISREGRALEFARGVILGVCEGKGFLGTKFLKDEPIAPGWRMVIRPIPDRRSAPWVTSLVVSVENE